MHFHPPCPIQRCCNQLFVVCVAGPVPMANFCCQCRRLCWLVWRSPHCLPGCHLPCATSRRYVPCLPPSLSPAIACTSTGSFFSPHLSCGSCHVGGSVGEGGEQGGLFLPSTPFCWLWRPFSPHTVVVSSPPISARTCSSPSTPFCSACICTLCCRPPDWHHQPQALSS